MDCIIHWWYTIYKSDQIENDKNDCQLDETKISCDECQKRHKTRKWMMKHIQRVCNENDFACKICPKKFTQSRNCKYYLKILTAKLKDNDQNYIYEVF